MCNNLEALSSARKLAWTPKDIKKKKKNLEALGEFYETLQKLLGNVGIS